MSPRRAMLALPQDWHRTGIPRQGQHSPGAGSQGTESADPHRVHGAPLHGTVPYGPLGGAGGGSGAVNQAKPVIQGAYGDDPSSQVWMVADTARGDVPGLAVSFG